MCTQANFTFATAYDKHRLDAQNKRVPCPAQNSIPAKHSPTADQVVTVPSHLHYVSLLNHAKAAEMLQAQSGIAC